MYCTISSFVVASEGTTNGERVDRQLRAELAIEVHGRADQREVGERLREVAEQLAGRADLLAVETDVVGVGEHLLEGEPRLLHTPGARQRLDVPEGADREGPVAAGQS